MQKENKIRNFIQENLNGLDEEVLIDRNDDLFKMGFVNSLFAMNLLNFIEGEFNITIEPEDMDLDNFSTINNIVQLIEKRMVK